MITVHIFGMTIMSNRSYDMLTNNLSWHKRQEDLWHRAYHKQIEMTSELIARLSCENYYLKTHRI